MFLILPMIHHRKQNLNKKRIYKQYKPFYRTLKKLPIC